MRAWIAFTKWYCCCTSKNSTKYCLVFSSML